MPEVTPISKRCANKYFNWSSYFRDMYVSAVRAGTGAFLAFAGSNTAESVAPDVLQGVGMNWQQALAAAVSALVFDLVRYVNLHPLPEETGGSNPPQ
jgi:hypothetical protein